MMSQAAVTHMPRVHCLKAHTQTLLNLVDFDTHTYRLGTQHP